MIKRDDRERDYVRDHEKSLIALLVPAHIEYTRQVLERVDRRRETIVQVVVDDLELVERMDIELGDTIGAGI